MLLLADDAQVYAVGWATLAMLGAGIAQGKNRSGLAWFLITALFGPLGIFFLVIVEKLPGREIITAAANPNH